MSNCFWSISWPRDRRWSFGNSLLPLCLNNWINCVGHNIFHVDFNCFLQLLLLKGVRASEYNFQVTQRRLNFADDIFVVRKGSIPSTQGFALYLHLLDIVFLLYQWLLGECSIVIPRLSFSFLRECSARHPRIKKYILTNVLTIGSDYDSPEFLKCKRGYPVKISKQWIWGFLANEVIRLTWK